MKEDEINLQHIMRAHQKVTRVGPLQYQAVVPELQALDKQALRASLLSRQVYSHSRLSAKALCEYLEFVDWFMCEKESDGLLLGSTGREQHHEKAIQFLAKMDYSVVKAKYFIVFPCQLAISQFLGERIILSDQQMEQEIEEHFDGLRNNKMKACQKWKASLQNLFRERAHLSKISSHIQAGKSAKFEIPEPLAEELTIAIRTSKQIKRLLTGRHPIDTLRAKLSSASALRVTTNEYLQLKDLMQRLQAWLVEEQALISEFVNAETEQLFPGVRLPIQRISKHYQGLKALPMAEAKNSLKEVLDTFCQLSTKLQVYSSRKGQSKATLLEAKRLVDQLTALPVDSEHLLRLRKDFQRILELHEHHYMLLQDPIELSACRSFNQSVRCLNELFIRSDLPELLVRFSDYFTQIDLVRKALLSPEKLADSIVGLEVLSRKYPTEEATALLNTARRAKDWNERVRQILTVCRDGFPTIVALYFEKDFRKKLIMEEDIFRCQTMSDSLLGLDRVLLDQLRVLATDFRKVTADIDSFQGLPLRNALAWLLEVLRLGIANQRILHMVEAAKRTLAQLIKMNSFIRKFKIQVETPFFNAEEDVAFYRAVPRSSFSIEELQEVLAEFPAEYRGLSEYSACANFLARLSEFRADVQAFLSKEQKEEEEYLARLQKCDYLAVDPCVRERLQISRKVFGLRKLLKLGHEQSILSNPRVKRICEQCSAVLLTIDPDLQKDQLKSSALSFLDKYEEEILFAAELFSNFQTTRQLKCNELTRLQKDFEEIQKHLTPSQLSEMGEGVQSAISRFKNFRRLKAKADSRKFVGYYFQLPILICLFKEGIELGLGPEEFAKSKTHLRAVIEQRAKLEQPCLTYNDLENAYIEIRNLQAFLPRFFRIKRQFRYLRDWSSIAKKVVETVPVLRFESKDLQPQVQRVEEKSKRLKKTPRNLIAEEFVLQAAGRKKRKLQTAVAESQIEVENQGEPYCICLKGDLNADIDWILCEKCRRWFHCQCLFLRMHPLRISEFICQACILRAGESPVDQLLEKWPWYKNNKLTPSQWQTLREEGERLPMGMRELAQIKVIQAERQQFEAKAKQLLALRPGAYKQYAEQYHTTVETQVFLLISKSIWLPVVNEYQSHLVSTLRNIDFANDTKRALGSRSRNKLLSISQQRRDYELNEENRELLRQVQSRLAELEKGKRSEEVPCGSTKFERDGLTYIGQVAEGELVRGRVLNPEGRLIYEGEFRDMKFHGRGTQFNMDWTVLPLNFNFQSLDISALGNSWMKFEGEFERGLRSGSGTLHLDESLTFECEFREGEANGDGCILKNGVKIIKGVWHKNRIFQ